MDLSQRVGGITLEGDGAAGRASEFHQEVGEGGFAGPDAAHYGDVFAGGEMEGKVVEEGFG